MISFKKEVFVLVTQLENKIRTDDKRLLKRVCDKASQEEFKERCIVLALKEGVREASKKLKMAESTLYRWSKTARKIACLSRRRIDKRELKRQYKRAEKQRLEEKAISEMLQKALELLKKEQKPKTFVLFSFLEGYIKKNPDKKRFTKAFLKALNVSSSGYYKFLKRRALLKKNQSKEEARKALIVSAFHEYKGKHGYRIIHQILLRKGLRFSLYEVRKALQQNNLKARKKTSFKPQTTDSKHSEAISARIFKTEKKHTRPKKINEVWVSDITYLPFKGSFIYLVVFLDLYSRKVVGFRFANSLSTDFVESALCDAVKTRSYSPRLIIHSDRGVQYTSGQLRGRIKKLRFKQSMSRKGNCLDNAHSETFFATLKKEVDIKGVSSVEELKANVFKWIAGYYNKKRPHSSLNYLSPEEFEIIEEIKMREEVK